MQHIAKLYIGGPTAQDFICLACTNTFFVNMAASQFISTCNSSRQCNLLIGNYPANTRR